VLENEDRGASAAGLVIRTCSDDVTAVAQRCRAELDRRGIAVFAVFDHGAGARQAGLDLAPEIVLVFGDPAVGTRLMQIDPTVGVELPLRLVIWEQDGSARVGFIDPATWAARYALPNDHPVLAGMRTLLDQLADVAAGT
jgi:uncharacterized protein (DUF302 family)